MLRRQSSASALVLTADQERALIHLFEASQAAGELGTPALGFASQLPSLHDLEVTDTALRWLIAKGFAEHRLEITKPRQQRRVFRPAPNLRFSTASCFILTNTGMALAANLATKGEPRLDLPHRKTKCHLPQYDGDRRALFFNGQVVKQFKVRAENQELILMSFEEEKWPPHLADPLPGKRDIDAKRRLSDAIKNLNAHQTNRLVRFHGDGTGTGILWAKVT